MTDYLNDALQWFFDELEIFALWLVGNLMDALAALIAYIPVPEFLQNLPSYTLSDSMAYFAEPFQLEYGAGIIVLAYTIRFIIRRLPVVG